MGIDPLPALHQENSWLLWQTTLPLILLGGPLPTAMRRLLLMLPNLPQPLSFPSSSSSSFSGPSASLFPLAVARRVGCGVHGVEDTGGRQGPQVPTVPDDDLHDPWFPGWVTQRRSQGRAISRACADPHCVGVGVGGGRCVWLLSCVCVGVWLLSC